MRTPLIAANWKMFKTRAETEVFLRELGGVAAQVPGVDLVVAPPSTALTTAVDAARGTRIAIAAQNLYFEREGAFTGEISARMIADTGATHVIVGHSERRRLFGDTDAWVTRKVRAALHETLTPIVCTSSAAFWLGRLLRSSVPPALSSVIFLRLPRRLRADVVDEESHSLVVRGVEPEHSIEDALGFLEARQAPQA